MGAMTNVGGVDIDEECEREMDVKKRGGASGLWDSNPGSLEI